MNHATPRVRLGARSLVLASGFWLLASLPAPGIVDFNSNGMSDLWELSVNGFALLPASVNPQDDPDSDGWTNSQEAAAGTNPFDPNPPGGYLRPEIGYTRTIVIDPDFPDGDPMVVECAEITWPTLAGKRYALFSSDDLTLQSWLPMDSPFTGNGSVVTYHFPIGDSPKSCYKVAIGDTETNYDGLTEYEESQLADNTGVWTDDWDSDGLSNAEEYAYGFDPNLADSNGDGIGDLEQFSNEHPASTHDADGDGASDAIEFTAGSDPKSSTSVPPCDPFLVWMSRRGDATEQSTASPIHTAYEYKTFSSIEKPPTLSSVDAALDCGLLLAKVISTAYPPFEQALYRVPLKAFRGLPSTEWADGTRHYGNELTIHSDSYHLTRPVQKLAAITSQNLRLENDWAAPEDITYRFLKVHLKAPMPSPRDPNFSSEMQSWAIPTSAYTKVAEDTELVELTIKKDEKVSEPYDLEPPPAEPGTYHLVGLLPMEVVQPKLNGNGDKITDQNGIEQIEVVKTIRFCRWLDSFTGNDLDSDCAENDRDHFRIRIPAVLPGLTKIHIKSTGLLTAVIDGQWVSKSTDGDYDVTMIEENGAMVSTWMLLVSDGDDDDDEGYNGKGTDDHTDDQTLLANFNSPIEVTLPEYDNAMVVFHAQKPLGDLEIQPYYLSPAGDLPPDKERFIVNHLEKMKEIYRQIGIRVGYYGIVGKAVPPSWFDAVTTPNQAADYFTPTESNLARATVRGFTVPGKQIRIGFVNATVMQETLIKPPFPVRGFTDQDTDGIIISLELLDARLILGVTAHETGHALGLDHPLSTFKRWLMRGGGGNVMIWENKPPDSKRFLSGDFEIIGNSQSFYVPYVPN